MHSVQIFFYCIKRKLIYRWLLRSDLTPLTGLQRPGQRLTSDQEKKPTHAIPTPKFMRGIILNQSSQTPYSYTPTIRHITCLHVKHPNLYVPRNKNCKSSGLKRSMATLSLLTVPAIMAAFFSCSATIRDSTLSSMQRRVMTQGRF